MDRDVVICRDLSQIQDMFESSNIMKGYKPIAQQKEDFEKANEDDGENKIFRIPAEVFEDFKEIDHENEELFEYVAFTIVIQFLEKCCLKLEQDGGPVFDTAIEFPDCIASAGRSKLHEIGNYFGLAHHSCGKKGKNRRFLMYPKTLFKEK